jgi:hypothetical protein
MTQTRKIKLNFKGLAEKAVQEISVSTCGAAVSDGLRVIFIAESIRRMRLQRTELNCLFTEGAGQIDEIKAHLLRAGSAIADLENVTPASLGGVGGSGLMHSRIDEVRRSTEQCEDAAGKLKSVTMKVRHLIDEGKYRDAKVYEEAELLLPAGSNDDMKRQVSGLRHDFEASARHAKTFCDEADTASDDAHMSYSKGQSLVSYKRAQIAEGEEREARRRQQEQEERRRYGGGNGSRSYGYGDDGW